MQIPDIVSALWAWLTDPGGIIAALITAAVIGLAVATRKRIAAFILSLQSRHDARMRAKYTTPCERAHVDDLPEFRHPAKFEVRGEEHAATAAVRCVLVNVGHGDAFGVVAETDPMGNVEVRGPASWDAVESGHAVPVHLVCDYFDLQLVQSIRVSWRDASGDEQIDDAPLASGAERAVEIQSRF